MSKYQATFLIAAVFSLPATAFNVGPYRIGMSDSEARKIGIGVCSPDPLKKNRVVCDVRGEFVPSIGIREANVYFDSGRRLVEIKMVIESDHEKEVFPTLNIRTCPEKWSNGRWCYSPPSEVRAIWHDSSSRPCQFRWCKGIKEPLRISLMHDSSHVRAFFTTKERESKRSRFAESIQSGSRK